MYRTFITPQNINEKSNSIETNHPQEQKKNRNIIRNVRNGANSTEQLPSFSKSRKTVVY